MSRALAAIAVAALAAASPAAAQEAAPAGEIAPLVLEAGTRVPMVTVAALSSKRAQEGQRFDLTVAEDVLVGGLVAIPKGARGVGEVSRVVGKGVGGRAGKLQVRVLFVEIGGARIRLDGKAGEKGASGLAPVVLAAPLVGIFAGFISGKSATLPAGTPVDGFVHDDVPLVRP